MKNMLSERIATSVLTREEVMQNMPVIMGGTCAVETKEQTLKMARTLVKVGVDTMRGQLWKPRSSINSFQGVGLEGIDWLRQAKEETGLRIATEIVDKDHIDPTKGVIDILWVGSRNMQNFELLKALRRDDRPVILKRGFAATIEEWLQSADYIGRERVILCERGIRTPVDSTRFTLDLNGALVAKFDKGMPVLVDPSHPAGRRDLVPNLAYAAIAAGLDGVIVETHEDPDNAKSDNAQQVLPEVFEEMVGKIRSIHHLMNS